MALALRVGKTLALGCLFRRVNFEQMAGEGVYRWQRKGKNETWQEKHLRAPIPTFAIITFL
jgi:hypothetical protein